ncbi:hypothetical protein RJ641_017008 [Dillenia turbinata]|uniref:U1-type domain-containing protein n=1 Tax=Dillenia turbinata TaxID=194707 RepID=A0AAN8YZ72_9MAGN
MEIDDLVSKIIVLLGNGCKDFFRTSIIYSKLGANTAFTGLWKSIISVYSFIMVTRKEKLHFVGSSSHASLKSNMISERPLHKGHRKRGGKSFMRGGHAALTHGRGRDWSNGQRFPPLASASTASNLPHAASTPVPGGPPKASIQPPLASGPSMVPFPTQAHASSVPIRPSRLAWCELCRVDCNTFEILEQHKNGKKHKKKELQKLKKVMTGTITEQMSVPISIIQPNVVQPNAESVDLKQGSPGKLPVEDSKCDKASSDDRNGERDQQKNLPEKVQNHVAELNENQAGEQKTDHSGVCGRGLKRHLRGRQGAKRMRTNQWHRRRADPSKPKEGISLTWKLCNVKCGSQVVFDSKKHLSKLERFHGNQPILGNGDLQATFSTIPNTPSFSLAHIDQQTLLGCRNFVALLVEYILPQATAAAFAPTAAPLQANGSVSEPPLAVASESASETHQQQLPNREMTDACISIRIKKIGRSFGGTLANLEDNFLVLVIASSAIAGLEPVSIKSPRNFTAHTINSPSLIWISPSPPTPLPLYKVVPTADGFGMSELITYALGIHEKQLIQVLIRLYPLSHSSKIKI